MTSKGSLFNFFVTLISGTGLIILLSMFISGGYSFRSSAKTGGVRMLKMKVGESAFVFCRGLNIRPTGAEFGLPRAWTCEGKQVDDYKPKPSSDMRFVYLQEGQTFTIDCPNGLDIMSVTRDNEFTVYCRDDNIPPTPSPGEALIWLEPFNNSALIGDTAFVTITLSDFENVFGGEVYISFDPTILQVIDADVDLPGVQIIPGTNLTSCPFADFTALNTTDNSLGIIDYAATQLNPRPTCTDGDMAAIEFQCISEGVSYVDFTNTIIADPDGKPITHNSHNSSVNCIAPDTN
ncbi:cohesin domain-containing protein [Patescibacteria group bacterium]